MRIRIQLFFKTIGIYDYDHWYIQALQGSIVCVHGPPRLRFEPLKLYD
jgi:hypothetical protein